MTKKRWDIRKGDFKKIGLEKKKNGWKISFSIFVNHNLINAIKDA